MLGSSNDRFRHPNSFVPALTRIENLQQVKMEALCNKLRNA